MTDTEITDAERARQAGYDSGYEDGQSVVRENPPTFPVAGWQAPPWAQTTGAKMWNGAHVDFTREASVIPLVPAGPDDLPTPSPVALIRNDEIVLNADSGAFSVKQGATMIWLDIESVSVSEARKVAAALIELANYADGATE